MRYKHRNIVKRRQKRQGEKEYMFKTIEEFEKIVGYNVNYAFKAGWKMARTMMPKNIVDKYTKRDYTYEVLFKYTSNLHLWSKDDNLLDFRKIGDDAGKLQRAIIFDPKRGISITTDPGHKPVVWRS